MKKIILLVMAIVSFAFMVNAVTYTYMRVKMNDNQVFCYDVDQVERIDYENDTINGVRYMCAKTKDGKVNKYDVENVAAVDYKENTFTVDTTGTAAEGVTISGSVDGYSYVDLGFSNGILWATCNVGATKPYEYGDYFAWGETVPKQVYGVKTYLWCEGKNYTLTKYNNDSFFGRTDNKRTLEPEDDAATVNWGDEWRMPSEGELNVLWINCDWEWTDNFNGTSNSGFIGTSKYNGNTIFLPAAGAFYDSIPPSSHTTGDYFSSDVTWPQGSDNALRLQASKSSDNVVRMSVNSASRYYGFSVRPVYKKKYNVRFYGMNGELISSQRVEVGRSAKKVDAPYLQEYVFTGWSDSAFTSVNSDMDIYAQYEIAEVDGHAYVDLGLSSGNKWATCNVGASKSVEYGDYFAWGETKSKKDYSWESYKWCEGSDSTLTKYTDNVFDFNSITLFLESEDDAATVNWGNNWRTPNDDEVYEMVTGCERTWTPNYNGSGVAGEIGRSKTNGNVIFFPACGYYDSTELKEMGYYGGYWMSELPYSNPYGWGFTNSKAPYRTEVLRYIGRCVRAIVKE